MGIKLKSFRTMSNAGTSLTMPAFPDIATDDFILVVFGKDGSTGTWVESGSSDYTVVTGLPSSGGATYVSAFYRKATSGSEVPRIFDSGVSDDCGGYVVVWDGVDTTTPLADEQVDVFGSSVASFTPTAMTTTANNSVVCWFALADNIQGLDMEPGLMGFAPPWINGGGGINVNFAWTVQAASGTSITPKFAMPGAETGQLIGFSLTPASATDAPPYCDHANNPPGTIINTLRGSLTTGEYGGSAFDPTGTVTAIDGESTTYDAAGSVGGGGAGGLNTGMSQTYSSSDTGLRLAGWVLPAADLSGKTLSIQMGAYNLFSRFGSTADKGFVFGLRSGTVDYMFWTVGGVDSKPQFNTQKVGIEIDVDGGFEIDEIGTFDPTDVTGLVFGGNRTYSGGTISLACTEFHTLDRVIALGGSSVEPANTQTFIDAVAGNYLQTMPAKGITKQKLGIGDGTTPTYWKDDSAVMSAYVANAIDNSHQVSASYAADLEIYASASDTIDLTGQIWKGTGATPFLINASSSGSATYVVGGLTIISRAVTFQDVFTAAAGINLTNCTYTANSADLSGGCTFDNTPVTITAESTGTQNMDDVANCTFKNSAAAITITGDQSGTWDDPGLTVSGNTYDIEYTGTTNFTISSAATLTHNDTGGGVLTIATPTTSFTVTSTEASSDIKIFTDGTQTILASTTGTTVSYVYTGTPTLAATVMLAGFLPQRVTGQVMAGANVTVNITLVADPVYDSGHGLTYTTDASWQRAGNTLTVPTFGPSVRGVHSLMIESFIAEATLDNTAYNISMNGPNSMFLVEDAEGVADSSIEKMTAGGVRYLSSSDVVTAEWAGLESIGTIPGSNTGEYSIDDGTTIVDARTTGAFDEILKIYGDASHGNFDSRAEFVVKFQINGYREARADVQAIYGISTTEPTLYIISLAPVAIEAATGDPALTIVITDHGASPVSWNGKNFTITVIDNATPSSGEDLLREINYNLAQDASYQSKDPFNWPEMLKEVVAGTSYDTIYGYTEGAQSSTFKGVRVVKNDGSTAHPDFTQFQSDDGTYYVVPITSNISITGMPVAGNEIRLQIHNDTAKTASAWGATTAYSLGDKVLRSTGLGSESTAGLYMVCTTAGTSNDTEPTWDTTPGNTTADTAGSGAGDVVWTTYAILFYDADPVSASFADTYVEGEEFITGDTYRIRFAELNTTTSFKTYESTGLVSSTGFTVAVSVITDAVYAANGIDGSSAAVTAKFTADYTNDQIDLDANQDFAVTEAFAYFSYETTTSSGMFEFWGGVTAIDSGNYRNNTAVVSIYFDETAGFVKQTDSARWFRDDDTRPVIDPTTGGAGLELNWRNPVYQLETGVSGLTGSESTELFKNSTILTDTTAILVDTGTTLPASIAVIDSNVDAVKAKTDDLTFTKANELDSNIQSVDGTTITGSGTELDPWGP